MFFLSALLYGWQNLGHGARMALDPVLGGLLWTQTGSSTGGARPLLRGELNEGTLYRQPLQHRPLPAATRGGAPTA